jgi:hypothetical protein
MTELAREYIGSIHLHTTSSDGAASHLEVAGIAAQAGLDFLIVTDHNAYASGLDGWYSDVLLLVGEEINDSRLDPAANHYLALDIQRHVAGDGASSQEIIDAVSAQGGFGFIAHPFELSPPFTKEPELPWIDWQVTGYTGLEIWNYMSEFKSYLRDLPRALSFIVCPQAAITGPFPETLAKWDELLFHQRTAAIAGTDAHGNIYELGPLRRALLPYEHCFKALRTHILASEPLNRDLEHDLEVVYAALKGGRSFAAYDAIGDATGFRFQARGDQITATMGEEISLSGEICFEVESPLRADMRLLKDGHVVAQERGKSLRYTTREPGVYRVEAYRRHLLKSRGWVFTNPIYVRP